MMEDLKQRLKFEDITVRTRCVQKLVQIVKKKAKGELITATSQQIPELTLLWETCLNESPTTSDFVIQGIVHLVVNRILDINFAINKLLGSVASSSNVHAIVKGISKVVIYQYKQKNNDNYSLHHPRHPLIAVLQSNEDYLPLVLENIADAVTQENTNGFQAMEPVISYLLYNPGGKRNYAKVLLLETLIDAIETEPKAAFYVLRCIPYLQIDTYEQASEASCFILKAKNAFDDLSNSESDDFYISELFLLASLSLSQICLTLGHDPTRLLDLAYTISLSLVKTRYSSYVNVCLILISLTLKSATSLHAEKLVSIAVALLEFKSISPTVASFLAFSVIQILPEPSIMSFNDNAKSNLSQLLKMLEPYFLNHQIPNTSEQLNEENTASKMDKESYSNIFIESFTFSVQSSVMCAQFAQKLDQFNLTSKLNWLKSLQNHVNRISSQENLDVVFSIVAALFLGSHDDQDYLSCCLDTFDTILSKNNHLSTKVFALLLYKQSILKLPESKFLVLSFLPKSAAHKFAIPPVISILSKMSGEPELRAFSIHLMLQLWKKQDRIFSYLHKQLVDSNKIISKDTNLNETLISQAAAINEICLLAPEKHGSDFLSTLSKIFNDSNDEASSPAACLALDGVISLCKAEIIDLRSTWKLLGPRLSKDKRTPVTCRMYELLSLIPDLQVKSPEFDAFMKETAAKIWKQITTGILPPDAEKEAYKTLSKFPFTYFELKQLPLAAKANLVLPVSLKSTPFDMGKSPEDVLTYIPGYAFTDLMKNIENEIVLQGYAEFLSSLIEQEVSTLPRSAYSKRKRQQKRQTDNEALQKIPQFLCAQFESRRSPSLQKNIAFGVLLSYEPPLEIGKDGEPIKRSVAYQYRFYEQVLGILLNEVNIDATEWQRSILLPGAWGAFMDRCFFTYEDARKTELELQRNLGHLDVSAEEYNIQCKTTWLWVRDRIMNLIKTCVKNAPTSHANAICAIAGLVPAVNKFYASLDDASKALSEDSENFIKHEIFIAECTETILCAMKPNYKPNGKVHSWLLTHLSRPNSSSGYLVKGCSCASLCHLTSVLINNHNNDIANLIQDLLENLTHTSPVLSFYSGVGLGLFLKALCDVGYLDTGETQSQLLIDTTKSVFNLSSSAESSSTSVLISFTLIMTTLTQTSSEDHKDWISTTCNIFHEKLLAEEVSSMNFEVLSICVSAMMIAATEGSCINIETVESLATWFETKQAELQQCSGTSVALGMLIESLERFGCPLGQNLKQKLQKEWLNTLSSEKRPTLHRLAALNGLCSLYSCGRGLLQAKSKVNDGSSMINDVVSLICQLLTATRCTGLQNVSSWEVGRLFSIHSLNQETEESVPSSYHYLNEKSVLKFVVNTIIESHNDGKSVIKPLHQLTCLKAINGEFSKPLPPLNWITVLGPLLQNQEDQNLIENVLCILIHQGKSSPHATNLLASYCCPPLIHTLPEKSWKIYLKNIPNLASTLPPPKLQMFLQTVISFIVKQKEKFQILGNLVMQGISEIFQLTNLKQQSTKTVQDAFISIFKIFKNNSLIHEHIDWICSGLLCLPEKKMESLLCVAKNNSDIAVLTAIWCAFVKTGKKTLSSLRPCIEEGKHASPGDKEYICASIYDCFLNGIHNKESELNQPEKCISWLIETIGWINVLIDSKSKFQLLTVGEIFIFLNDVCMSTLIGCSGLECSYNLLPVLNLTHQQLIENLPVAITKLCKNECWLKAMDKVIEWILVLLKCQHLEESDKHFLKLCLCSMRNLSEFQKIDVWTNVINNIY